MFDGNAALKLFPMPDAWDGFGERCAARRNALGLTQFEVGERMGVRNTAIWKYEAEQHRPRGKKLDKLAAALETTPRWLVFGDEPAGVGEGIAVYGSRPPSLEEFLATPEGGTATEGEINKMMEAGARFDFEPTATTWRLLLATLRSGRARPTPTRNHLRYRRP